MRKSEAPLCEMINFSDVMKLCDMIGTPANSCGTTVLALEFDRFLHFFGLSQ
jgi:hypothetical protein